MLVLVRHGETALNAARVLQPEDTPLSDQGIHQAAALAARLSRLGVGRILSSDLPRARMTAAPIAQMSGAPVEYTPLLRERSFGALRGTPYVELKVNLLSTGYEPPGGESVSVFHDRVDRAWTHLQSELARTTENVIVVTHGLVCGCLVDRHLRLPEGRRLPMRFGNTSVTVVGHEAPHAIEVLACVQHLTLEELDDHDGATA